MLRAYLWLATVQRWDFVPTKIAFPKGVGFSNCAICEFDYDGKLHLDKLILPTKDFETYLFERDENQ